jgi:uncharacterized protein (DUF302 family)
MDLKTTLSGFILIARTLSTHIAIADTDTDGLVRVKSHNSVITTIDKLQAALEKKGMTIFKRIDHAAGGKEAGIDIRPTELLIFGNPKIGTKLMQCSQTAAIDLPQKALAFEDASGQVWLVYNDPLYMANRHHAEGCEQVVTKVSKVLANFSKIATE